MPLHKLFIFTKDTDALATEQGFQYQKLKTLKTWLESRINKVDGDILCDYEEDILQRNLKERKLKFRQVKLYSTNFSFSREEVQKSIAHFFMLFVKGEYKFDEVEFSFETNSGVAKEVSGNDANLLREWSANQDSMDADLKNRCRERVKVILNEYIKEAHQAGLKGENETDLKEAKKIYDELTDDTWDGFVGSIKWQFDAIPQNQAIPLLLEEIAALIPDLPLPLNTAHTSTYISILHFEIAQRTAQKNEADKVLTNQLLDVLLLNAGSEQEKWYASVYEKWLSVCEILHFRTGAFYEVINATRHCRWEMHRSDHESIWLSLLKKYIDLHETIVLCRRKAIYEYLFLMLSPHPETFQSKGEITGEPGLVRYYFNELEERNAFADMEEDIVLLQLVQGQQLSNEPFIEEQELQQWAGKIEQTIDEKIAKPLNPDELCQAYELKGQFIFHLNPLTPLKERAEAAIATYKQILEPLKEAASYSISRLNEQLNQFLNMLISFKQDEEVVSAVESFIMEIEEQAEKTGKQHNAAHSLVLRGDAYLKSPSAKNCLKALDCFHKAKMLWFLLETKEGFILALINIAQVYSMLRMNLAAKYYALSGVWAAFHFGDYTTLKRTSDSYALVFHADFREGAWISALEDFTQYIKLKLEFTPDGFSLQENSILQKTLIDLSCILSVVPKIHPALTVFIQNQKESLGWLYTGYLKKMIETFDEQFEKEETIRQVISNKLSAQPLNDIGAERVVEFTLLGVGWRIAFQNTAIQNAIAEEFCSLLQITLGEVGLQDIDLHLLEIPVTIHIFEAADYTRFVKQRPSHENTEWDFGIPASDTQERNKVRVHYAFLAANIKRVLKDFSLLTKEAFDKAFDNLYLKQKLGEKAVAAQSYQRVYFNLTSQEAFEGTMRSMFEPLPGPEYIVEPADVLLPVKGDSQNYKQSQIIAHIHNRYTGTLKRLNVSLPIWKEQPEFKSLISELRKEGWLDWQIMVALMNFVLSTKANMYVETLRIQDKEKRRKAFEVEMERIFDLPEEECYEEIPVEWLQTPDFRFYLIKLPVDVLPSYGLQNHMSYPNFGAVKAFLNQRLHFDTDNSEENSPLGDL